MEIVNRKAAGTVDFGRHYDERSPIGDEMRDGQIHMWYWYDRQDDASLAEACQRVSRKVADTLGLRPGEHLLDAGCGPGETAVFIAREYGARVTGVTVSAFEIERATERAADSGLADRVTFQYGDFTGLEFPDGSFDAVLALESLQNAPDVGQVLAELYRVLRPGGRISFSDFSRESDEEPERLAKFLESLRMHELPTLPEWLRHVEAAGFEVEEYTQCGPRVFGRKAKYLENAVARRGDITAKFGEAEVAQFTRVHQGFFTPRKDQVGYVIISARKPHRR